MQIEPIEWGLEKDGLLRQKFGFGFERVLEAIDEGGIIAIRDHPNQTDYGHQRQMIVRIDGYAWVVPFIVREYGIFLKTMFPSRVETKRYIGGMQ